MIAKKVLVSIFILFSIINLKSQVVTVSQDISIRNNLAYDIIGRVGDRILFYKDKGNERELHLYNDELVLQSERQINLDKKRCVLYEVINLDTAFAILYGYKDEGNDILKLDIFSNSASRLDSVVINRTEREWRGLEFESITSEDESKISLYRIDSEDKIKIITIDVDLKKAIKQKDFVFEKTDLYSDLDQVLLSNDGTLNLLMQSNNFKNRKKDHYAHIFQFHPYEDNAREITIPLQDIVCQDLIMTINRNNSKIGIVGLYDEKRRDESTGYFWVSGDLKNFGEQELNLVPFDEEIYFEVYGERNSGKMENFRVADIIWKADASPIIILEMSYDVSRNAGGIGYADQTTYYGRRNSGFLRGWSDHYRDDLILMSLDTKGEKLWHQVFYKKQFSQNDNAVFSSFFPFITPSRLRLIYNDEIKTNSTVSEYILDSNGNYKRTSVLSTEYQDLKLRFADANQISPTELLVPSQQSYSVNIVKIDFGN